MILFLSPVWEAVSLLWLRGFRTSTQVWGQSKIINRTVRFSEVRERHLSCRRCIKSSRTLAARRVSKRVRTSPHRPDLTSLPHILMRNGCCLTSTPGFIVWTTKMKMNPARLVDRTGCLRDPIPVSAIKWKLPFTYSSGLINYSLSCAFIKAQWNMGSKLHCVPVSCYVKAV